MPVPRNRLSNARKNSRRAHDKKTPRAITTCVKCKSPARPHHACASCGHYKGRSYIAQPQENA